MSSRDDFARSAAATRAAQPAAQPMVLTGSAAGPQVGAGGAPAAGDTGSTQPAMALSEPAPPAGAAPAATLPANKKLLTPEEKARLIAELEALAKSQSAR
jgi:hypothetical protein